MIQQMLELTGILGKQMFEYNKKATKASVEHLVRTHTENIKWTNLINIIHSKSYTRAFEIMNIKLHWSVAVFWDWIRDRKKFVNYICDV